MANTTSKVTKSDIRKSTTRAGCVDLGKVRELRTARKKKRSDNLKKINDQKNKIVEEFQVAYIHIIGGEFKMRHRTSFTSWKDKNGTLYKRKNPTDKQRLWEAYKYAEEHNGATIEDMPSYFEAAIIEAQEKYTVKSPRQIFGYVVNQGVIDTWFMNLSKRRRHAQENEKIEARARAHAELFDR